MFPVNPGISVVATSHHIDPVAVAFAYACASYVSAMYDIEGEGIFFIDTIIQFRPEIGINRFYMYRWIFVKTQEQVDVCSSCGELYIKFGVNFLFQKKRS